MKALYLFLSLLLLGACTSEGVYPNGDSDISPSNTRDVSEAAQIAANAKKFFSNEAQQCLSSSKRSHLRQLQLIYMDK